MPRKVDKFAGQGSVAEMLKRRRELIEAGKPEEAAKVNMQTVKKKPKSNGNNGNKSKEHQIKPPVQRKGAQRKR